MCTLGWFPVHYFEAGWVSEPNMALGRVEVSFDFDLQNMGPPSLKLLQFYGAVACVTRLEQHLES